jgi:hypothetical protein
MTVEPVIGNIKQNLGFREFLLKGLEKVKIEMSLVSIAHIVNQLNNSVSNWLVYYYLPTASHER